MTQWEVEEHDSISLGVRLNEIGEAQDWNNMYIYYKESEITDSWLEVKRSKIQEKKIPPWDMKQARLRFDKCMTQLKIGEGYDSQADEK